MDKLSLRKVCATLMVDVYSVSGGRNFYRWGNTEMVITELADTVIVTFRGSDSLSDWNTNLSAFPSTRTKVGRFHRGYHARVISLIVDLDSVLAKFVDKGKDLVFNGHSKAGQEAQIAAVYSKWHVTQIVTFGSPKGIAKLYDPKYEKDLTKRTTHYVNRCDSVTKLPCWWKRIGKTVAFSLELSGHDHSAERAYLAHFNNL